MQKERSEERLMKEAGEDWRKSKLVFVISGLLTSLYDIRACISNLLRANDQICSSIACINGKRYVTESTVNMSELSNYMHFDAGGTKPSCVKQWSDQWHEIRSGAIITGSTLNDALCLRTLKKQTEHYDQVIMNVAKPEPSESIKEIMDYGT